MKLLATALCMTALAVLNTSARPAASADRAAVDSAPPSIAELIEHFDPDAFGTACGGCPADVDGDGFVTFNDVLIVVSSWGPCPGCPADVNGDGFVDFGDLLLVLAAHQADGPWRETTGHPSA